MSDDNDETIDAGPEVLRAVQEELAARQARAARAADPAADNTDVDSLELDSTRPGDQSVPVWTPGNAEPDDADDFDDADLTVARPDAEAVVESGDVGEFDDADLTVARPDAEPVVEPADVGDFDDADLTVARPDAEPVAAGEVDPTVPLPAQSLEQPGVVSRRGAEPVVLGPVSAPSDPSPARDFVREARERAEAAPQQRAAIDTKQRRSGLWVVLSIVFGAQIIAGGLYLALTALGDDGEQVAETDEVVTGADAGEAPVPLAIEPTVNPTPTPAPTPVGTPTPVPPTPTWMPVTDGPRSAPFTYVIEAIGATPPVFDGRDGGELDLTVDGRSIPLTNPLPSGAPLVLRVVGGEPGDEWVQVELPGQATVGWVRSGDFVWNSTTVLVQVDLFTNTLRVFDENTAMYTASIASGTRGRPTPQLSTYVFEASGVGSDDQSDRIRLAHFGSRPAVGDGLGALVIEPVDDAEALRVDSGYTTDGRILLGRDDFAVIATMVAAGSKVEIVGVPAAPTPTPLPDARNNPADPSQGGFFGCPPATRGTPPNCYRLVDRLTVPGECAGLEVLFEDDCYLLGGNPELDALGLNCQQNAPTEIGGLCYLKVGPVPQLPGECPEGARDVGGECRVPV